MPKYSIYYSLSRLTRSYKVDIKGEEFQHLLEDMAARGVIVHNKRFKPPQIMLRHEKALGALLVGEHQFISLDDRFMQNRIAPNWHRAGWPVENPLSKQAGASDCPQSDPDKKR